MRASSLVNYQSMGVEQRVQCIGDDFVSIDIAGGLCIF
jgi:hypothetical protein